jgi:hypothetical protein
VVPAVWSGPVQHHIGCLQVHVHHTGSTNGQQATPHVMQHLDKEGQGARHAHLHHNTTHNTTQHSTPQPHAHWTVAPPTQRSGRAGIQHHTKEHGARRQGGKGGRGNMLFARHSARQPPAGCTFMYVGLHLLGSKPAQRVLPNLHTPHTHSRTLNIVRASARLMLCMAMR